MSKISNKPDHSLNSPLKPTSFPIDMSLFQVSQASSNNKKSTVPTEKTSIYFSSTKATQAQPNLFQYNDRSPLIFSSDEEDQAQPHFNYYPEGQQIVPSGQSGQTVSPFVLDSNNAAIKQNELPVSSQIKLGTKELTINQLLKGEQKPIKGSQTDKNVEQIPLKKTYHIGAKSNHSSHKKEDNAIQMSKAQPKKLSSNAEQTKIAEPSMPKQNSKSNNLNPSKSENLMGVQKLPNQRESSLKQNSSFSKTDEIIQRVQFTKKESIIIEQQSDKSSQKKYQQPEKKPQHSAVIIRDSTQSNPGMYQKKRRNRIFDNSSSTKIKQKKNSITPEKGVQTQGAFNNSFSHPQVAKQYDYYPQIKALNVLNKIVDQIAPNVSKVSRRRIQPQQSFTDFVQACINDIQAANRALNNITIIDKVEEPNLIRLRNEIKEKSKNVKGKISKLRNIRIDEQLVQYQQNIYKKFQSLYIEFQEIDSAIQGYIDTKQRLNYLMENSKSFMVNLKRGQLKRIYYILRQMTVQVERLKQTRATCGNLRIQRMFREYLQGEIKQLIELEEQMREKVDKATSACKK